MLLLLLLPMMMILIVLLVGVLSLWCRSSAMPTHTTSITAAIINIAASLKHWHWRDGTPARASLRSSRCCRSSPLRCCILWWLLLQVLLRPR